MSDLAQRYGTERAWRRPAFVAVVVVLAAAGLAWLVWAMLFHGRPLARSALVTFENPTEHAVTATVTVVRRSDDVEASCLLRASAADHSVVGELNFTVDSSDAERATITRTVRTEREATTVELVGCVADGQQKRH
ncbi:MAG TPA: DUF4307 domain-containing protein [Nocardioidaceae bacterium]|nr:DUF4307 domain-containing protein [Nocardioidaceae bacterium]